MLKQHGVRCLLSVSTWD